MIHSERLASFLAFGEDLNFTRAAKRVHLSQPSLFAQIKKLESDLETRLYKKRGRMLELTVEGSRLLAHAREAYRRDQALVAELRGRPSQQPLVLAAGEGALHYLLPSALIRLRKAGGARLSVLTRNSEDTIRAVAQGEATVGVTAMTGHQEGVESSPVALVGLHAVMPKTHDLAKKRSLSLGTLSGEPLVTAPRPFPHRENLERLFSDAGSSLNATTEANGWASMMHLAALGLGVAIVNDFCTPPKGAVARPIQGVPKLEYRFLWRSGDDSADTLLMRSAVLSQR